MVEASWNIAEVHVAKLVMFIIVIVAVNDVNSFLIGIYRIYH